MSETIIYHADGSMSSLDGFKVQVTMTLGTLKEIEWLLRKLDTTLLIDADNHLSLNLDIPSAAPSDDPDARFIREQQKLEEERQRFVEQEERENI